MKYLFLSAHCDDSELSCGGTMLKLASEGHHVHYVSMTYCGNKQLTIECQKAANILKVELFINDFTVRSFTDNRQQIADYFYRLKEFDFVFTHSCSDKHPDHRTIAEESLRIFKCNLITYLAPWNGTENSNYYVGISEEQLEKKIHALSCYKSQDHRSYMRPEFIRSQAVFNGIKCGKQYAEAFRIEKLIQ